MHIIEVANHNWTDIAERIVYLFHKWQQTAGNKNLQTAIEKAFRTLEWYADLNKFQEYMRNPPTLQEQKVSEGTSDFAFMNCEELSFPTITQNKLNLHRFESDGCASHLKRVVSHKFIMKTSLKQTVRHQSYNSDDCSLNKMKRKQTSTECNNGHPYYRECKYRKLESCDTIYRKKDNKEKANLKTPSVKYKTETITKHDVDGKRRTVLLIKKMDNKSIPPCPQIKSKRYTKKCVKRNRRRKITGRKSGVAAFSDDKSESLSPYPDLGHSEPGLYTCTTSERGTANEIREHKALNCNKEQENATFNNTFNNTESADKECSSKDQRPDIEPECHRKSKNISKRRLADELCKSKQTENERLAIISLVEKQVDNGLESNEYQVFVNIILELFSKNYQPKPRILELKMEDLNKKVSGFFLPKDDGVVLFSTDEWKLLQLYLKARSKLNCSVEVEEVIVTYNGVPLKDA